MADTRNTIKFLVATDNHLGAYEKTPVRRDDSFVTFEEILEKAVEHKVDFVLLAGDLFDENKPSHRTLHRTMELLRRYCMGNKRIDIELVSDPALSMSNGVFGVANFQDPNLNISIPVFCIHGNHDDPVGEHALSALDLLSVSGLVNYFGKSPSNDNIVLHPLLFTKGTTKLGLYGLGHIREERLHRCFVHKKVKFMRPSEDTQDWFNCMAIHQNRNVKGVAKKNGVKEEMLKGFLDLVIWGHEHEQLLAATPAVGAEYDIIQPGSSIMATPNSEELNPKKIAVVEVHGTAYRVTPVTLKSTRPVEFCTVVLQEEVCSPLEVNP
ncbi:Double-strand break repair protein mus-23 [Diplonema papillatum]|nr:Double-strand break repair protein mus-23 [Diplonema papillatum]